MSSWVSAPNVRFPRQHKEQKAEGGQSLTGRDETVFISTHRRGSLLLQRWRWSARGKASGGPLWRLGIVEIDATVGATCRSVFSLSGKC